MPSRNDIAPERDPLAAAGVLTVQDANGGSGGWKRSTRRIIAW